MASIELKNQMICPIPWAKPDGRFGPSERIRLRAAATQLSTMSGVTGSFPMLRNLMTSEALSPLIMSNEAGSR